VLARWNPWEELQQIERQMAEMTRRAFGTARAGQSQRTLVPAVDVFTRDGDLVVRVELPGMDPERDIDVSVQDGVLVIRGERRFEEQTEAENYVRLESAYGAFQRAIPLPERVSEEDIQANYQDGILEIIVPGAGKPRQPKKVPVSAGSRLQAVQTGGRRSARGGARSAEKASTSEGSTAKASRGGAIARTSAAAPTSEKKPT